MTYAVDPVEVLGALVAEIEALKANSLGVYGLCANGDMSPWPTVKLPTLAGAKMIVGGING